MFSNGCDYISLFLLVIPARAYDTSDTLSFRTNAGDWDHLFKGLWNPSTPFFLHDASLGLSQLIERYHV